ncbi:hypothetical protein CYMTET_13268 [Cymbomonas tetramitiformis]|uniref:Uncharacterized protein n=1 Tax=Cymbomonas tetramitiformis TaxID=36881 RepID=A0AAE0GIV4_9CHLO|nr:hypothetical protein CYMTET_13268 [Cymbomonas tetramitiformis]
MLAAQNISVCTSGWRRIKEAQSKWPRTDTALQFYSFCFLPYPANGFAANRNFTITSGTRPIRRASCLGVIVTLLPAGCTALLTASCRELATRSKRPACAAQLVSNLRSEISLEAARACGNLEMRQIALAHRRTALDHRQVDAHTNTLGAL